MEEAHYTFNFRFDGDVIIVSAGRYGHVMIARLTKSQDGWQMERYVSEFESFERDFNSLESAISFLNDNPSIGG